MKRFYMNKQTIWIFACIAALTLVASSVYKMIEQRQLQKDTTVSHDTSPLFETSSHPQIVERVVSSSQLWRPVQDKVKDTVVQIFSHVAHTNILQPYASPSQGVANGSGFFVSDQGDLITNAHVIEQAKGVWVQIPSLGKRIIDCDIVGVTPDRDLALLRVKPEGLEIIKQELGAVPYLALGDSDLVRRSDDVLALGYPLGQQSLKSTTGVYSGREGNLLQISAPINPGSSGGPLLNARGEVVGINSSGITEAQNVGYAIPVNDLKIVLPDLERVRILRKPYLGVLFNNANEDQTEYLGNPRPGGCYVTEVVTGSPLDKAGVQREDMIYEINGHRIDIYGELKLPFSEDKISIIDYVSRLPLGENINLVVYRKGERKDFSIPFDMPERPAIHDVYLGFEDVDYEIIGGMVVMPLTLNHLPLLGSRAPGLAKYTEARYQSKPALVVTHIFPNSQLYRSRNLPVGSTINQVNDIEVHTLDDFRDAIKKGTHSKFITIRASDNVTRKSDNLLVVLRTEKVLEEEPRLARDFRYPLTQLTLSLLQSHQVNKSLAKDVLQLPSDLTITSQNETKETA
jgi:serine protease Do